MLKWSQEVNIILFSNLSDTTYINTFYLPFWFTFNQYKRFLYRMINSHTFLPSYLSHAANIIHLSEFWKPNWNTGHKYLDRTLKLNNNHTDTEIETKSWQNHSKTDIKFNSIRFHKLTYATDWIFFWWRDFCLLNRQHEN